MGFNSGLKVLKTVSVTNLLLTNCVMYYHNRNSFALLQVRSQDATPTVRPVIDSASSDVREFQ
jgi:hypothetical protein